MSQNKDCFYFVFLAGNAYRESNFPGYFILLSFPGWIFRSLDFSFCVCLGKFVKVSSISDWLKWLFTQIQVCL